MKVGTLIGLTASTIAFIGTVTAPLNIVVLLFTTRCIPLRPVMFMILSAITFYLWIHFVSGNISTAELLKNTGRFLLPFLVALMAFGRLKRLPDYGVPAVILGITMIASLDMIGVLLYLAKTGDFLSIYDIKNKNLIFQNTNYTAFLLFSSLVAQLTISQIVQKRIFTITLILLILTYSRSYWAATTITLIFHFTVIPNRAFLASVLGGASFAPILAATTNIDPDLIRAQVDSSFATKFEILLYSNRLLKSDTNLGFWGLGPQNIIEEFEITHTGHSLFGMMPELGFLYIIIVSFLVYYTFSGGRYSKLHFPGTILFLFSTFPISNLAIHLLFLLISQDNKK